MKNYIDITKEWLESATPNTHKVKDSYYYVHKGIKYKVYKKEVVLDYSKKEKEIAEWLENTFGGKIFILPKVNKPKCIKTADYLFKNEHWDLKEIYGKSRQVLYHAIYRKKKQSSNFIFDTSNSELDLGSLTNQVQELYSRKDLSFIRKIILKNKNEVKVYKRK